MDMVVQGSRKQSPFALALIVGGLLAFLGVDPDQRPLGLEKRVMAGILIRPGFGCLIQGRREQDHARRASVGQAESLD